LNYLKEEEEEEEEDITQRLQTK